MAQRDWVQWHRDYDDPGSLLSRRGELVQGHLRAELERAPAGGVRLISLCAGQGRDVIGVLTGHPRRDDVRVRLVELDERNVALARQAAQAAGLRGVEVLQGDAGITDACVGAVPAQVVVACGIFGNISDSDIQATVAALPSLCTSAALVLWTRHRGAPDLTPAIRSWFAEAGFREEAFDTSPDGFMSVGAHRLTGEPTTLALGQRLFTFRGRNLGLGQITSPRIERRPLTVGELRIGTGHYLTALEVPAVADQVYEALAEVLNTPSGRCAQLVAAALILRNLTRLPDPGRLAARLHAYTDTLLA